MVSETVTSSAFISTLEEMLDVGAGLESINELVSALLSNPRLREAVVKGLAERHIFALTPAQVIRLLRRRKGGDPFRENLPLVKAAYHDLLTMHHGNVSAVAKDIGFDRRYVTRHILGVGINPNDYREKPYERHSRTDAPYLLPK